MDVGERVVGHQPLGDDAVVEEPVERALGEGGDSDGGLVVVDLAVGQAAAVVDDRVHVLPADAARAAGAVAGDGVPGLLEAAELLGVHVQKLARARPQIAHHRWPLGPWTAETPARQSTRCTVECERTIPGSSASRRALQPVRLRSSQIRRSPGPAPGPGSGADGSSAPEGTPATPARRPTPHAGAPPTHERSTGRTSPRPRPGRTSTVLDDTANDFVATPRGKARSMVRHSGLLEDVSSHPHPLGRPGPTPSPRSQRPWARHLAPSPHRTGRFKAFPSLDSGFGFAAGRSTPAGLAPGELERTTRPRVHPQVEGRPGCPGRSRRSSVPFG